MMKKILFCTAALFSLVRAALAADIADDQTQIKAVESANGKVDINGGFEAINGQAGQLGVNGGVAFAMPLGDKFGFQADFGANSNLGNGLYSADAHFFTRNPNSYLLGMVGGGVWGANSASYYAGPEVEFYSGKVSLEGTAALMSQTLAGANSTTGWGKATVAYYANPNLRLEVGAKDVAGFKSAHTGLEWKMSDASPIAFNLTGTVGDNSYLGAMAGVTLYFGGKQGSLLDRQRRFDPGNTGLDLMSGGSGSAFVPSNSSACPAGWVPLTGNALSDYTSFTNTPKWWPKPDAGLNTSAVGNCISPQFAKWLNTYD